jgi:hypothetical protein
MNERDDEDRECEEPELRLSEQDDRSAKASKLPTNRLAHPKDVFRFRSFEEFNKWKEKFGLETSPPDPTS